MCKRTPHLKAIQQIETPSFAKTYVAIGTPVQEQDAHARHSTASPVRLPAAILAVSLFRCVALDCVVLRYIALGCVGIRCRPPNAMQRNETVPLPQGHSEN